MGDKLQRRRRERQLKLQASQPPPLPLTQKQLKAAKGRNWFADALLPGLLLVIVLVAGAGVAIHHFGYWEKWGLPDIPEVDLSADDGQAGAAPSFDLPFIEDSQTVLPLPRNGMAYFPTGRTPEVDFEIINRSKTVHSLVKFEDAQSGEVVAKIFVHSGQSVLKKLPSGTYQIKYASGETWYGEPALFGSGTQVGAFKDAFTLHGLGSQFRHTETPSIEINVEGFSWEKSDSRSVPKFSW